MASVAVLASAATRNGMLDFVFPFPHSVETLGTGTGSPAVTRM